MSNPTKPVDGKLRVFAGGLVMLDNPVSTAIADCAMCGDIPFAEANAAELVRRWNMHHELIETLQDALTCLDGGRYLMGDKIYLEEPYAFIKKALEKALNATKASVK